jgi:hypothetical protein
MSEQNRTSTGAEHAAAQQSCAGRDGRPEVGPSGRRGGIRGSSPGQAQLARLSDEFFEVVHTTDPFNATQVGVSGFDALVPDPSRDGAARGARRVASIETRLGAIDAGLLGEGDLTNHAVLARLAWGARSDLEHGLWEGNASAGGYVSPQAIVFQSVPTAVLGDEAAGAVPLGVLDQVVTRWADGSPP